jgi:hypothetical protein
MLLTLALNDTHEIVVHLRYKKVQNEKAIFLIYSGCANIMQGIERI